MNAAEIVMKEVQRDLVRVVLEFFAKSVCQASNIILALREDYVLRLKP